MTDWAQTSFFIIAGVLYIIPIITIFMMIRANVGGNDDPVPTKELWLKAVLWPITMLQVILALRRGGFKLPHQKEEPKDDDPDGNF